MPPSALGLIPIFGHAGLCTLGNYKTYPMSNKSVVMITRRGSEEKSQSTGGGKNLPFDEMSTLWRRSGDGEDNRGDDGEFSEWKLHFLRRRHCVP